MSRRLTAFVASLVLAAPIARAAESWPLSLDVGLVHSDNIGRARFDADRRSDAALELDLATRFQPAWQTRGVFTIELSAGADLHERYSALDQLRLGIGASYRQRLGLGPTAPWWSLDARLGWQEVDDGKRDGSLARIGLSAGRAWDAGWELRGRLGYERRDGDGGRTGRDPRAVFDLASWHAGIDLDYAADAGWGLFAAIGWRRGEFNTSTRGVLPLPLPWTHDDAFGAGFRTYRIDADVATARLGARFELAPATQLLASAEMLDARARTGPATYDGTTLSLQVQHEF